MSHKKQKIRKQIEEDLDIDAEIKKDLDERQRLDEEDREHLRDIEADDNFAWYQRQIFGDDYLGDLYENDVLGGSD